MNTPTQEQIESWLCEAETMSGPSTNEFATLAYQAGRAAALEELWAGGVELPEQSLWVVVRETVLDVGLGDDVRTGGRSELGYALISNAGTFSSEEEAVAALKSVGLPIGWVVMPLSRLLPDLSSKAINYGDRRAAAAAAAAPQWQPIETAPKDGRRVLVAVEGVDRVVVAFWNGSAWSTVDANDWSGRSVTHWMPLPQPPEINP